MVVKDPFWPIDEKDPKKVSQVDFVAITHTHFNNFPGLFEVAKTNSNVIVSTVFELAFYLKAHGIKNVQPLV